MKKNKKEDTLDKFLPEPNSGCWIWMGYIDSTSGYGKICYDGHKRRAHVVVYELLVGLIPRGLQLDHLCRTKCCVNPQHLEPVTPRINVLRSDSIVAQNARKTHCKYGHPFSVENIYRTPKGRHCLTCKRLAERAKYKTHYRPRYLLPTST